MISLQYEKYTKKTAKCAELVVAVVGSQSLTKCPALLARLAELAPD